MPLAQRSFFYMPSVHSESVLVHAQAIALFSRSEMEDPLRFELRHKDIIDRFGRAEHTESEILRSLNFTYLLTFQPHGLDSFLLQREGQKTNSESACRHPC